MVFVLLWFANFNDPKKVKWAITLDSLVHILAIFSIYLTAIIVFCYLLYFVYSYSVEYGNK